ncbi:MAG TPA: argininosuccinate lyase [Methanospirillum sp.]|uniref:argininosuccinate lyase n=1 Tax=Methanospirillum sp. TaxID=45200 RepID=UPI002CFC4411|nr:argininosuccinate lyase [Methanospirillum sp.]HOJ96913.1 argininosuccinate lyase [Methanospirillum sp.]HPP77668.1 argininosuccinate lyase [Methanospirillum sp.]
MTRDVVRKARLFGERTEDIESLLSSMEADRNIASSDVLVDMAHLVMLTRQRIVHEDHAKTLMKELLAMYESGVPSEAFDPSYEDIHAGIETILTSRTGSDVGGRLHIGRSRNDEVATCLRIRTRDIILDQLEALTRLRKVLLSVAEEHITTVMPGFTHLQHAQPVTLAHHLLAYEQMFSRDFDRLFDAFRRVNCSPLGSAALASTGYPLDRICTAHLLGCDQILENSMDAVASRDFAEETLACDAIVLTNISRFCEELIIWSSSFVQFVTLDDRYCSTSSIMPQKKNPDVAELLRSRAGTILGAFVSAVTIVKGLPMAYNRDLQDVNPHLWRGISEVRRDIDLLAGMIESAQFNRDRMAAEAGKGGTTTTELADTLVREYNIPFRTAHHIVGRAVRDGSLDLATLDTAAVEYYGKSLSSLGITNEKIENALAVNTSLSVRNLPGGPAPETVRNAIIERRKELEKDICMISEKRKRIAESLHELLTQARRIAQL